ncbi:response regulator [Pseudomonas sp. TKO26]|uniref:response regulator n=1 Tax=unclassified Pseudomonas TaxID=196821 RepID=UPI000D993670|nr:MULTISPECIES: response regulator [unclassified Pseudomonas]PYY79511.1 response regulator [Pseudomonas sp. TKO29]PYY84151.1 response regulator [Pseudomonas sp. TKO30]PYY88461.1 response regulator [Pseudomonas sp. TKO26]PYY98752.1 response regulator [Pseudomonas sp. TKO14]
MPAEHAPKPYTLLAIDDDPQSLIVLSKTLTCEYEVLLAKNSERGLALARSASPDLIILDILMPEMDGFQVLSELKSHPATASIPVIFLTSRSSVEDERLGLLLGAADYIAKPISPPVVLARVATQLGYRNKPLHGPQAAAEPGAGSHMRDGFISALTLQLADNPQIRLDALLDTLSILLRQSPSRHAPAAFRSAACLALMGLNQPHSRIDQALGQSRLLIEEILAHAEPEDPILNLAWEITHADALLKAPGELQSGEQLPVSAYLFALVLNYHLSLLQAGTEDLHSRHAHAMAQLYRQPGFEQCIDGAPQLLAAALLGSSQSFFGR